MAPLEPEAGSLAAVAAAKLKLWGVVAAQSEVVAEKPAKWEVAIGLQVLAAVLTIVVPLIVGTGDVLSSHSSPPVLAVIEPQVAQGLGPGVGLLTPEPP